MTPAGSRSWPRPAAVSTGELLRRTVRPDGADRGHRPDADLRRATPAASACRVRWPLQHRAAASGTAATVVAPSTPVPAPVHGGIRRRPILGGLLNEYEAAA